MLAGDHFELIRDVRVSWDCTVTKIAMDVVCVTICELCRAHDLHLVARLHLGQNQIEASDLLELGDLELYRMVLSQLLSGILNQFEIICELSCPVYPGILVGLTFLTFLRFCDGENVYF